MTFARRCRRGTLQSTVSVSTGTINLARPACYQASQATSLVPSTRFEPVTFSSATLVIFGYLQPLTYDLQGCTGDMPFVPELNESSDSDTGN